MADFYTGKGDKGMTTFFGSAQQYPKSALRVESLGVVDEVNALLGLCKVRAGDMRLPIEGNGSEKKGQTPFVCRPEGRCAQMGSDPFFATPQTISAALEQIQQDLFIVQAEVAGAGKHLSDEKVTWLEQIIAAIEAELPPVTTFLLSGGSELAALLDVARTVVRTAERRLVSFRHDGAMTGLEAGQPRATTLVYLNRLSSTLYALARWVNHWEQKTEIPPKYR